MGKQTKPTQKDWDKIEALYLKGEKPRFIAEKFPNLQITAIQISKRFSKKNLNEKKRRIEKKVKEKLEETIIDIKVQRNQEHIEQFDFLAKKIIEKIKKDTYQVVAGKDPKIIDLENDLAQLARAATALEKIQKGQRLALGLDEKANINIDMPEVNIVENLADI
ncbi:MAG: hypothetical protein WCK67_07965 [bacterium]